MRIGVARVITNPKCPRGNRTEVQAIELRQFEEHDRVRLLDEAALDLGQVGVGPADSSFNLTERELAVHARPA